MLLLKPRLAALDSLLLRCRAAAETSRRESWDYADVLMDVLAEHPETNGIIDNESLCKACDSALYLGSGVAQVKRAQKWLDSK